jgi:hypothetical protein
MNGTAAIASRSPKAAGPPSAQSAHFVARLERPFVAQRGPIASTLYSTLFAQSNLKLALSFTQASSFETQASLLLRMRGRPLCTQSFTASTEKSGQKLAFAKTFAP